MELVSMQTLNHEDCCTIGIWALSDNLYNPSESVRWRRRRPFFCCSIVSAILASCALPVIDSTFWMSGGSDHLTLLVYHVCVSVHTLEVRSIGKGVQRVWLVSDTTWPWTQRTRHPRASWSTCDHCCRFFPLPHILQTCSSSYSTVLPFWKSTEYLSVCASYAPMVSALYCL